jgi:hypothetical protein
MVLGDLTVMSLRLKLNGGPFCTPTSPASGKVTGYKFQAAALVGAGQLMNPAVVSLLHLFEEKMDAWLETTTQTTFSVGLSPKS